MQKKNIANLTIGGVILTLIAVAFNFVDLLEYVECKPWKEYSECPWDNSNTTEIADTGGKVEIPTVAASLAELGYFQGDIIDIDMDKLKPALMSFQTDIKVIPTGQLDSATWDKLKMVRLSEATIQKYLQSAEIK